MTSDAPTIAIAALMDAVSLLRGEVAALARSNARIEESQEQLHRRIDVIDTGIGPLSDLLPYQEAILVKTVDGHADTHEWLKALAPVLHNLIERSDADRLTTSSMHQDVIRAQEQAGAVQKGTADIALGLEVIASRLDEAANANRKDRRVGIAKTLELIGFTRAAVLGQRGPLPINVEDAPLLERFILSQPADLTSNERALVEWRKAIAGTSAEDLIALLKMQQTPSPTDTPQSRLLRYRLAAITRAMIEERGGVPPPRPTTTRATDRSASSAFLRSQELAALWRKGESTELYAEPELAGALDVFDALDDQIAPSASDADQPKLTALHSDLAKRIELGERPTLDNSHPTRQPDRANTIEPSKDR